MNIVICDILLTIFSLWVAEATGGFLFRTESERHCQRHYSKDNILKNNISVILIVYFKKYIIILKNVGSQTVCVTIASHYMNRNTVEVKGKTETVWLATFFSVLQKKRKSYMFGMNRTEFQFFWGGGLTIPSRVKELESLIWESHIPGTHSGKLLSSRKVQRLQLSMKPHCWERKSAVSPSINIPITNNSEFVLTYHAKRTQQYMIAAPIMATALPSFWISSLLTLG